MIILAIDPGYDRVGLAVLEKSGSEKEKLIFSECFTTLKTDSLDKRIFSVGKRIEFLVKEYGVELFVIESLFFAKNTKTALSVAEAGAFIYQASLLSLPIYEYTPNQIKVAVTGNGAAHKRDIFYMVPKLITVDDKKRLDDELDAIAIGLTFFARDFFKTSL